MITKPKGTYDLLGKDARIYNYLSNVIDNYMDNYNYDLIRTPIFEASELFHRSVGETTDIVTKETYDFKDRGDRDITLRPEGTAGVVRSVIENKLYGNRNDVLKYYYLGTMYRYERPQSGRNREFTQFGVEAFNSDDPMLDAEVISVGYNLLQELDIPDITVKLNTLGDLESRKNYTEALVKYLKPHINELCEDCQRRLETNPLRILDCKYDRSLEKGRAILDKAPRINDYLTKESADRFKQLQKNLTLLDVDFEIDPNIVRGLDYYDHNVWEYVTKEGVTLGGGGRYNNLVETLGGPHLPAVGFAMGLERIILELNKVIEERFIEKQLDVYIMSVSEEEKLTALKLAQEFRLNNLRTEINTANLGLKSQFKIADGLKAKFLIILNNEDLKKGLINVKDNVTKEETKVDEKDILDWLMINI